MKLCKHSIFLITEYLTGWDTYQIKVAVFIVSIDRNNKLNHAKDHVQNNN